MENTNYHFEVQFEHLREALDRFAQFFIAPLFTEDAVDREMNAVHNGDRCSPHPSLSLLDHVIL